MAASGADVSPHLHPLSPPCPRGDTDLMESARRAAVGLVTSMVGVAAVFGAHTVATAAPALATNESYYHAAVNLLDPHTPGASGLMGGVSFSAVVGGSTSVNVFLSRATTVICEDGREEEESLTVRTMTDEAATPGPVTLDIDRRLRTAVGTAVVDLLEESSPGCGQDPTITVRPAQSVRITVQGSTVRFRTGMESRVSSGRDSALLRSVDFSRDGVGSASVGHYLRDATSESAFLKYAIDRTRSRGGTVDLPPNAAPAGGFGAVGAFTRERELDGNPVFEDLFVTATIGAAPARQQRLEAFALQSTLIACAEGGLGEVLQIIEGSGPAAITIDTRLAFANAAGAITAARFSFDSCTQSQTEEPVSVSVSLSLAATGAAVRSVDTRFQVRPGEGVTRERLTYRARPATGTASVGDVTGTPDLAAISRAGR